jgi:glucuronoxylan 4-O-methyltransferase
MTIALQDSKPSYALHSDEALRDLVAGNPGQGIFEEYVYLRDTIVQRSPCCLLVFGVGKDSACWLSANRSGETVFIEHEPEWIAVARQKVPGINVVQVRYDTKRKHWRRLMNRTDQLHMDDLPSSIASRSWDVIFVDSPQGGHDARPGRMKSIYTASVLARRSAEVDVLLHDCDREVEAVYSDLYFGSGFLVNEVRTLRHYRISGV